MNRYEEFWTLDYWGSGAKGILTPSKYYWGDRHPLYANESKFVFFDRSLATFLASDKVTELTYIGVGRFRILGLGGGGGKV